MTNHFHLLVRVPDREKLPRLTVEGLLTMLPLLYDDVQSLGIRQEIERAQASSDPTWLQHILARFELRRGDLSVFLKELKQRFTQWYNRRKGRRGTLWEDRFKRVIVEGSEAALLTMAAYIDLNGFLLRLNLCNFCFAMVVFSDATTRSARAGMNKCGIFVTGPFWAAWPL